MGRPDGCGAPFKYFTPLKNYMIENEKYFVGSCQIKFGNLEIKLIKAFMSKKPRYSHLDGTVFMNGEYLRYLCDVDGIVITDGNEIYGIYFQGKYIFYYVNTPQNVMYTSGDKKEIINVLRENPQNLVTMLFKKS